MSAKILSALRWPSFLPNFAIGSTFVFAHPMCLLVFQSFSGVHQSFIERFYLPNSMNMFFVQQLATPAASVAISGVYKKIGVPMASKNVKRSHIVTLLLNKNRSVCIKGFRRSLKVMCLI